MVKLKKMLSFVLVMTLLMTSVMSMQAESLTMEEMATNEAQSVESVSDGNAGEYNEVLPESVTAGDANEFTDSENEEESFEAIDESEGGIAVLSLRPIPEQRAYLVLNGYTDDELADFSVDTLISELQDSEGNSVEIPQDATTVWQYVKNMEDGIESYEEYSIGTGERMNLMKPEGATAFELQLIIGKGAQLNAENVRYIIKVYCSNFYSEELTFTLYAEDEGGNRNEVEPLDVQLYTSNTEFKDINGEPIEGNNYAYYVEEGEYIQPCIIMSSSLMEHPDISLKVYNQEEYCINQELGFELFPPITEQLCTQNVNATGYPLSSDGTAQFFVFYYLEDIQFDFAIVNFCIMGKVSELEGILVDDTRENIVADVLYEIDFENEQDIYNYVLKEGYGADEDYYCSLDAVSGISGNVNDQIVKAVKGVYTSIEEAAGQQDIKVALFLDKSSEGGYKANYSGEGVTFTVFFNDGAFGDKDYYHIVIKTTECTDIMREFTDKPIIGEADPWLRVVGAIDAEGNEYSVENSNVYIVENGKHINMDTYYGYGYQTIFINDENVDLSNFSPIFDYANTERVYAVMPGTTDKIDKNHTRDFGEENQQYTGIIINKDGTPNERNYWVTFKTLNNSGPELYVYGPDTQREVILDKYFEFKHDILIANIGNEELKNISVELENAKNVKLDPYWTVGGEGNNVLAPFTTITSDAEYGELNNLAKIRLLPDGDGGGDVEGTLVIKADGQDDVRITLHGKAENPEIITEKLDEAVKYVPYQHIIATDNIHSDWIDTKFSVVEGEDALPEGITFNHDTGELYGVPKVAGTYAFTIKAQFIANEQEDYFESNQKEFELVVKENTDENVYKESDVNAEQPEKGYGIEQHIGTKTGDYSFELETIEETVFISYGDLGEFVALWLNGERLEENTDYTKEEGSTKVTIQSQTMNDKSKKDGESNTIAMEFRKDEDGDGKGDDGAEMNRTSQNYTIKTETEAEKNQTAADGVIALIAKIPTPIILEAEEAVNNASAAYEKLTQAQKELVTNSETLQAAKAKIAELKEQKEVVKKDQEAANAVMKLILELPTPITLEVEEAVNNASTAYEKLTQAQKELVTNSETLQAAKAKIVELKKQKEETEKNQEAVNAVIKLISELPEKGKISLNDKEAVNAARRAYNNLTANQKNYVDNINRLIDAEKAVKALEQANNEQGNNDQGSNNQNSNNQGSSNSNSNTENNSKVSTVTLVGIFTDANGNALSDEIIEIHSVVQSGRTDGNGSIQFNDVEFGKHTIYVKADDGTSIAKKEFSIVQGSLITLRGSEIVAEPDSVFTFRMQVNGSELTFLSAENGNQALAPVIQEGNSPQTKDESDVVLWCVLMVVSLCGLILTTFMRRRMLWEEE